MPEKAPLAERVCVAIRIRSNGSIHPPVEIIERCWPVLVYLYEVRRISPHRPPDRGIRSNDSIVDLACEHCLIEGCYTTTSIMRSKGLRCGVRQLCEDAKLKDTVWQAMLKCEPERGYPPALPLSVRAREVEATTQGPPHNFKLSGPAQKLLELCKAVSLHDEDVRLCLERDPDQAAETYDDKSPVFEAFVCLLADNTGYTRDDIDAFVRRAGLGYGWGETQLADGTVLPNISELARDLISREEKLLQELVPFILTEYAHEAEEIGLTGKQEEGSNRRGGTTVSADAGETAPPKMTEWKPPDGYVSTKTLQNDGRYTKSEKNPAPSTIARWVERAEREGNPPIIVRDPKTGENWYPSDFIGEQWQRWNPKPSNCES